MNYINKYSFCYVFILQTYLNTFQFRLNKGGIVRDKKNKARICSLALA